MAETNPLLLFLSGTGLPAPVPEYEFHPTRKWRFDYAWPAHGLAVEIEGGTRKQGGGRHNRAGGYAEDCRKYNAAVRLGWAVLRFTTEQVLSGEAFDDVEAMLKDPISYPRL